MYRNQQRTMIQTMGCVAGIAIQIWVGAPVDRPPHEETCD